MEQLDNHAISEQHDSAETTIRTGRDDLIDGALWFALGTAILVGSWTMDRLAEQNINPYTVPGLVPGLLGAAMMILGAGMLLRGLRAKDAFMVTRPKPAASSYGRILLVISLCVAFAVGLVGHGLPFWFASALFVTTTIVVLRFQELRAGHRLPQGIATAIAIGTGTGTIVSFVFEKFFFVRLP